MGSGRAQVKSQSLYQRVMGTMIDWDGLVEAKF